jgi:hypothetical protein
MLGIGRTFLSRQVPGRVFFPIQEPVPGWLFKLSEFRS